MNGILNYVSNRALDAPRPLKVIVIGAGASGLVAAIRLKESVPSLDLVLYEKNKDVGGTWFENTYPGCACDIPAHVYQLSFESNPSWSKFYAPAPEILQYWKRITEKYALRSLIKFSHPVQEARWDDKASQWHVVVKDALTGTTKQDTGNVLITGTGVLNEWRWPSIPGLHDFKGDLMHSAAWKDGFNPSNKRVAVIGAGSSGIQIVPNLQPLVSGLDHYVRGRTWISTPMAAQALEKRGIESDNFEFTEDEIQTWLEDPEKYLEYRRELERVVQTGHGITYRGSETQKQARAYFEMLMTKRLAKKPEILKHILPAFSPLCKRLTPGPGYLEALAEPNVDVVTDGIKEITETGIRSKAGTFRKVDTIVCATGFDTTFTNRFPIFGQNNVSLGDRWREKYTSNYLSMTTDGFPNMFMLLGPNAGIGTGNLLIIIERMAAYITKCVAKIQRESIRSMQPSQKSVATFTAYCDQYFKNTVYSEECSSWYKTGDKVTALWPGSSLHAIKAMENPRWEDFEYTYIDGNPMAWIGNGETEADSDEKLDKAYYLTSTGLIQDDLPEIPNGKVSVENPFKK